MADLEKFWDAWKDSNPNKIADLSDAQLAAFYHYFSEAHTQTGDGQQLRAAAGRRDELRHEIARREADRQHKQAITLGGKTLKVSDRTLCWTRVAAVAAILGVIVTVLIGILQIWLANTGTSKPDKALLESLPQTTATISESPAQAANPNTDTPSPQPTAKIQSTAQP